MKQVGICILLCMGVALPCSGDHYYLKAEELEQELLELRRHLDQGGGILRPLDSVELEIMREEEEEAEASSTFKTIGRGRGENAVITGEVISIAVNRVAIIIYVSGGGEGLTSLYFLKIMLPFKRS
jgi:hypothetical protein